jgi:hypothetical protein
MVNFLDTDLGKIAFNAKKLSDAIAWYTALDENTKSFILGLIKNDQLSKGIDADGDTIGLYSYWTEIISEGRKEEGTPYNLYDTGAFYNSLRIIISGLSFIVEGNGQKDDENLFVKYGDNIVGLTNESLEKLAQELLPKYINYVREILQIG